MDNEFNGCPCTVIEPCSDQCTCSWGGYSRGCSRCASYGSLEQRISAANRIANAVWLYEKRMLEDPSADKGIR